MIASPDELSEVAKFVEAVVGDKHPKQLRVSEFKPETKVIWEKQDIDRLIDEFRSFVEDAWEEGRYLKLRN